METRMIGDIEYILTRKRVKNINIRIGINGCVAVSAPKFVLLHEIDQLILSKHDWIIDARREKSTRENDAQKPLAFTREECLEEFGKIADKIFPLFADILGGEKPILKVRSMKSCWGVCHTQKRTIVLNMRLMEKPFEAREYVIMHEFVHFIYPNHQRPFHNALAALMPDYKQRKALLK